MAKDKTKEKTVQLSFRIGEEDSKWLEEYAENNDISISQAIRKGVKILKRYEMASAQKKAPGSKK